MKTTGKLAAVPLDALRPDWHNPRFPPNITSDFGSDDDVYAYLDSQFDASSVAESIFKHGFFNSEPLIVIPIAYDEYTLGQQYDEYSDSQASAQSTYEDDAAGADRSGPKPATAPGIQPSRDGSSHADGANDTMIRYVVLEGNRRLAALKGLANAELRNKLADPRWKSFTYPVDLPSKIPVVIANSRAEVAPILGYRHVTGITPWEPFQQARYVAELIDGEGSQLSARTVAELIGRKTTEVRSFYRNYSIIEQARDFFEIEDTERLEDEFGIWNRAMASSDLRGFIDAPAPAHVVERVYPLPEDSGERLAELVDWIFGKPRNAVIQDGAAEYDSRRGRAITDSRQLNRLGRVISNPRGLEALRSGSKLEKAEKALLDDDARFLELLAQALESLEDAKQKASSSRVAAQRDKLRDIRVALDRIEELA